ncbi:MAG TPA: Arm DNA-binding domain-containing protein, partial [Burkholderiales bacterium]
MALTDLSARKAKPTSKPYKLSDEKGLYLLVNQTGKYWRFDYRFAGKRKTLALGVYDEVGLREARDRRDEARRLLAKSVDPSVERKLAKGQSADRAGDSFEAIAREWFAKYSSGWVPTHADRILR